MCPIHDAAAKGYATAAQAYVTGRPGYPPESDTWLREVVGLGPGATVVDLGAGTGKFLPYLRRTGARLVAVEPVAEMRAQIERDHDSVHVMNGTATAIPLADASVDAVVCAQSFHWFATPAAVAEIRRVLVPDGVLGLIWNVRDESVPWVAALTAIVDPFQSDSPRYRSGDWRRVFPAEGFAALGERHARNGHVGKPEQVIVDRMLSTSFIASLPPEQHAAVARQLRSLIAATPSLASAGDVTFPYDTAMFAYRKVS
ncbi:class I SAM-dependent methyltransferase [Vineibacter terrae]|uniref:class I SAM-dependent methyltransferase n=1 Tax=Vineibacter terrae TaxID=2586908 RepID=UPI002E36716B|nr:methyltransferase domain-containing protein [Vineibacter terrae]HEX2890235.1 methyltransferase domain-containing protein [Vineibacter terrae]